MPRVPPCMQPQTLAACNVLRRQAAHGRVEPNKTTASERRNSAPEVKLGTYYLVSKVPMAAQPDTSLGCLVSTTLALPPRKMMERASSRIGITWALRQCWYLAKQPGGIPSPPNRLHIAAARTGSSQVECDGALACRCTLRTCIRCNCFLR